MEQEFLRIQNDLRSQITLTDSRDFSELKLIAGVDLAYWQEGERERAVCCIVVLDAVTHQVIETKQADGIIDVPYMPGFLAFRELPLILKTVSLLEHKPELYVFDGNGYLHPRHMGIASHAALLLHTPSVGCAKTYYRVLDAQCPVPPEEAGRFADIVIGGEVFGRALRTHMGVKPVFVSVGSGISLDTATRLLLDLTEKESHIPLPTRLADLETHTARRLLRGE